LTENRCWTVSALNSGMNDGRCELEAQIKERLRAYPAVASVTLNFKQGRQLPDGWVRLTPETYCSTPEHTGHNLIPRARRGRLGQQHEQNRRQ
jgi:hypothetical protein